MIAPIPINAPTITSHRETIFPQKPIIIIMRNTASSGVLYPKSNKNVYLMFDKELGFIETSLEEINEMIGKGDIKKVPRRGI